MATTGESVCPFDRMVLQVGIDGSADGRDGNGRCRNARTARSAGSLSFTGSFISAKCSSILASRSARSSSTSMSAEVTSMLVTGSAVTTMRRTGVGASATACSTRCWNSSAFAKNSGASQRNSTSPGTSRACGITRNIVIAANTLDPAQHRRVRAPAVPQELDHGDRQRQVRCRGSRRTRPRRRNTPWTARIPSAGCARSGRRSREFEQPDRRGDHHRRQRAVRQVAQEIGSCHQEQGHRQRADDAGELGPGAGRFGDRRARGTAADREALEKARRQVGGAQRRSFPGSDRRWFSVLAA